MRFHLITNKNTLSLFFILFFFSIQVTTETYAMAHVGKNLITALRKKFFNYLKKKNNPKNSAALNNSLTTNNFVAVRKIEEVQNTPNLIAAFRYLSKKNDRELKIVTMPYKVFNYSIAEFTPMTNPHTIVFNPIINDISHSSALRILLHEFRHFQQFQTFDLNAKINQSDSPIKQQETLINYFTKFKQSPKSIYPPTVLKALEENKLKPQWNPLEYDADHWAAGQISCPLCLKIIQAEERLSNKVNHIQCQESKNAGYFDESDYKSFIIQAQNNKCCPAHTKRSNGLNDSDTIDEHTAIVNQLEQEIQIINQLCDQKTLTPIDQSQMQQYSESLRKINFLDKESGSLLLHLANYGRDKVDAMQHNKKIWRVILENEKQRREIKLLPESCDPKTK